MSPGGKGANQAAAAAAAGAQVRFIGAIGEDTAGQAAIKNLRSWGIDLSALQVVAEAASGEAHLLVSKHDAENLIIVSPGANEHLSPEFVAHELSTDSGEVLLTQLETPMTVLRACAEHSQAEWRILNPAPATSDDELHSLLNRFNVLIPNRTELAMLVGAPEPESLADVQACAARLNFDGALIVTLSSAGAALFASRTAEPLLISPPDVQPVDTTGAGDAFCGYLAFELAKHGDLEEAVRAAVYFAAKSTELPYAQLSAISTGVVL